MPGVEHGRHLVAALEDTAALHLSIPDHNSAELQLSYRDLLQLFLMWRDGLEGEIL